MAENLRQRAAKLFSGCQSAICAALEKFDGRDIFARDSWDRSDPDGSPGGGGVTCIMRNGLVFEQAGVNFSEVYGTLTQEIAARLVEEPGEVKFFAAGISLVLHPESPMIPTTHANFRYLEAGQKRWFGGGMDLTPYYLNEDDPRHFHRTIKRICDRHDTAFYPHFKKWCDEYFYLPHRQETRGVGGIFFDYLGKDNPAHLEKLFAFVSDISNSFLDCYLPIAVARRRDKYGAREKDFQLLRRGRYVEFNLLYDRGTQFGLKTGGRTESILMSLPPKVHWAYNQTFPEESLEGKLIRVLQQPREWL